MSFVNMNAANIFANLKEAHHEFPRSNLLRDALGETVTEHYAKASLKKTFETRGLLVTGPSRTGKSTEISRQLSELNNGTTLMPDGRPAKFVSVVLKGHMTWKDLGLHTLNAGLGYPAARMTCRDAWATVEFQAEGQGVVGIHYDECQHMFSKHNPTANAIILDSFKALLKQINWPIMLILSGVDELADYVAQEEQLNHLLRPIAFGEIAVRKAEDRDELAALCFGFADRANISFVNLHTEDFYRRLAFASVDRWGLAIELIIDAMKIARTANQSAVTMDNFSLAYSHSTGGSADFSPFVIEDYEAAFDGRKIIEMIEKTKRK